MQHIIPRFFLLIILLTPLSILPTSFSLRAQTLIGRVADSSGSPVGYATVSLLSKGDSAFVAGTTTGDDGRFSLATDRKEGLLRVSCIGYKTLLAPFTGNDAGTLTLQAEATELQGVEVAVQKRFVKQDIDRLSYDVQADEESKTVTVMDMLRKVPLVTVDGDDNIKVKGSSAFRIYKNGHPDPSLTRNAKEVLKAMPASSVKRIEVITEPGAREDAEGVANILNIVMTDTKSMGGMTGTVGTHLTTSGYNQLSTFLTAQKGKFTTSLQYGLNFMTKRSTRSRNIGDYSYTQTGNTLHTEAKGTNKGYIQWADLSASYEIDTLNLLSLSFGGMMYRVDPIGGGTQTMYDAEGNMLYSVYNHYTFDRYLSHSWNGRFDYEHRTRRKNEVLTLSYMLDFSRNPTDQRNTYVTEGSAPMDYDYSRLNKRERFTEHTFQADWVRPITKQHKIEIGAKYIYRLNSSDNLMEYQRLSPEPATLSSEHRLFDHTTRVAAGYADYMFTHKRWSARAGLRYEWSRMEGRFPSGDGERYHTTLRDWVPQLSVKWQISDAQSLKLSYTTSINRPGIGYLNPAVVRGPNSVNFGNAHLYSARIYSISLNYMLVSPRLTLSAHPYYAWSDRMIVPVETIRDDVHYSTYGNVGINRRMALSLYAQWKPWKTTSVTLNITPERVGREMRQAGLKLHCNDVQVYANVQQELWWKLRFSASVSGALGRQADDVYNYDGHYLHTFFSLQRSFLKEDRLTVRLQAFAPFNKYTEYHTYYINGDRLGHHLYLNNGNQFRINISYRFGKLKAQVKKAANSIQNNDVVGGIKRQ